MLERQRADLHPYNLYCSLMLLYLVATLVKQSRSQEPRCSIESETIVAKLRKIVNKTESYDCRLYTPTLDANENCFKSKLTCFAKEVNVLDFEIKDTSSWSRELYARLIRLIKKLQDSGGPCPHCEVYKEENADMFLEKLSVFLQWINSKYCNQRG